METAMMRSQEIYVREPKTENELITFIRFPWKIYKGDRYWVPPLIKDHLKKFSLNNPFRSHSDMIFFLACQGENTLGRVAGIIDHNYIAFRQEKVGFFGFFESIPDIDVAGKLLSKVEVWLRGHGMEKMIGPMNPSTNDECGLLIDGFDASPCLMMPYNPRYYPSLLEEFGLEEAMDLYAYWIEKSPALYNRLNRITERLMKKEPQLFVRPLNFRFFDEELKIIKEIYNHAWIKNWGFVPLTEAEIDDMARALKPIIVPDLILFAYWGEEPVGISVSLPDYNEVLKHLNGKIGFFGGLKFLYFSRKIKTIRWMLLGIKQAFQKKGVEALLYSETFKRGIEKGSSTCRMFLDSPRQSSDPERY